jgi:hypothetical protein
MLDAIWMMIIGGVFGIGMILTTAKYYHMFFIVGSFKGVDIFNLIIFSLLSALVVGIDAAILYVGYHDFLLLRKI